MFKPFWDDLARGGVETIVFDVMAVPLNDDAPGLQVINWNTQCNFAASSNRPEVLKPIQRNFRQKAHRRRDTSQKIPASARRRSRPAHPVNAEKDGRNPMGHAASSTGDASSPPITRAIAPDTTFGRYGRISPPIRQRMRCSTSIARSTPRSAACSARWTFPTRRLVLFSMHGMTAGYAQDHFLPEIIQRINHLYLSKFGHQVPPRRPGSGPRVATDGARLDTTPHSRAGWPDGSGLAGRSRMEGRQRLEDDSGVSGPDRRRCRLHQIERSRARAGRLSSRGGRSKLGLFGVPLPAAEGASHKGDERTPDRRDRARSRCVSWSA